MTMGSVTEIVGTVHGNPGSGSDKQNCRQQSLANRVYTVSEANRVALGRGQRRLIDGKNLKMRASRRLLPCARPWWYAQEAHSRWRSSMCGGEGGIRTPGPPEGTADFESAPFGHSGTSPGTGRTSRTGGGIVGNRRPCGNVRNIGRSSTRFGRDDRFRDGVDSPIEARFPTVAAAGRNSQACARRIRVNVSRRALPFGPPRRARASAPRSPPSCPAPPGRTGR